MQWTVLCILQGGPLHIMTGAFKRIIISWLCLREWQKITPSTSSRSHQTLVGFYLDLQEYDHLHFCKPDSQLSTKGGSAQVDDLGCFGHRHVRNRNKISPRTGRLNLQWFSGRSILQTWRSSRMSWVRKEQHLENGWAAVVLNCAVLAAEHNWYRYIRITVLVCIRVAVVFLVIENSE